MQLFVGLVLLAILAASVSAAAEMTIASGGKARCVIVVQKGSTESERYAAQELADHLAKITRVTITVTDKEPGAEEPAIIVGPGPVASRLFPEVDLPKFGGEELLMKVKGNALLLAGGRPRGTLYAVYRFLQTKCGVRWWTPWATHIPQKKDLSFAALDVREKPVFESRDQWWFAAFDGDWSARNYSNSGSARTQAKHGGHIVWEGFVHTITALVPPEKLYATHPEWFALLDGKRSEWGAELCTTNPALRDYVLEQVRKLLRANPSIDIVSISQGDNQDNCQCPVCKASDEKYESPAGTLLELVNHVAAGIKDEFPNVAVETLAYRYTRPAPKHIKPLPNVIIRLCSIECNFAAPLTDQSNTAFAKDIIEWGKICNRIYAWDYTTDFHHYVQPYPNWFVEGPNARFYRDHGAKGLFAEGAYNSNGAEMAEMRAWVENQLMWNPDQDDKKLIQEFLNGYYGRTAAKHIRAYMDLLAKEAQGYYMDCYADPDAPFLRFAVLSKAEALWQRAEAAVKGNPELEFRVRMGHLPLYYVWLTRWSNLRRECLLAHGVWPVNPSRKALADTFLAICETQGPATWSGVTVINEQTVKPQDYVAQFKVDPPDPVFPTRKPAVGLPEGISGVNPADCIDVQDNLADLLREGEMTEMRPDAFASDGVAAWIPNTHRERAFTLNFRSLPKKARTGKWKVYAVVRVDKDADASGNVLVTGIYDIKTRSDAIQMSVAAKDAVPGYRAFLVGTLGLTSERSLWIAPGASKGVRGIWVDRVYLVPAE